MKEYIVREDIVKLANEIKDNFAPLHRAVIDAFIYNIETNIPAADMVEVKHGELIETTEWIGSMAFDCIKCSACEDKWIMDEDYDLDFYKEQWAYCPFCGAKLNGGKNNGNL